MDLCGGFELITDRLRHRHISAGWLSTPQVCVWSWGGVATLIARIFNDPEAVLEGNAEGTNSSHDRTSCTGVQDTSEVPTGYQPLKGATDSSVRSLDDAP